MCQTPERQLNPPDHGDYSQSEIDDANATAQSTIFGGAQAVYEYFSDEPVDLEICEALASLLVCREVYQQSAIDTLRTLMAKRMAKTISEEAERLL